MFSNIFPTLFGAQELNIVENPQYDLLVNVLEDVNAPGPSGLEEAVVQENQLVTCGTQTCSALTCNSPRKRKLKSEIMGLKRKLARTEAKVTVNTISDEDFMKYCDVNFPENIAKFIKMQRKLLHYSQSTGVRYSNDFKKFVLIIHFLGPKVYNFLKKTFKLPSKSTLCRMTSKWDISVGINNFIFEILKAKVATLNESAKDCVICMDEMSIKEHLFYNQNKDEILGFHQIKAKVFKPARNALVLMIRGVNIKWKQTVAYFLLHSACSSADLKWIIFNIVQKLRYTGLNVLALISDQGSNFVKFTKDMGITLERPFFNVDDNKIYFMFDVPHLIKSVRNNFFKYSIHSGSGATDKKYVDHFYNSDKVLSIRLAPKLTDQHLQPSQFQKMRVKYAVQVLSATVAAGLSTYIALGALPSAATETANFIDKMDKLFDMFNSSHFGNPKEYNRPFVGNDKQKCFLREMDIFLKNLTIIDKTGKNVTKVLKCFYGWRLTISAFLNIWKDLESKGINKIFTRRLNQDSLENFFGSIRQQGGNCRNPTSIQFCRAFKKLFLLNYFQHSEGSNCIEDLDSILVSNIEETLNHFHNYNSLLFQQSNCLSLTIDTTDYLNLNVLSKNAFTYVCGYFIKKCLSKHTCELCSVYAQSVHELNEGTLYCHFRAYETKNQSTFGSLKMPAVPFCEYIRQLDITFCETFPLLSIHPCVGAKIRDALRQILFQPPCSKFPSDYLISLFIRVRIYFVLKFANRNFGLGSRKNEKLIILKHL